MWVNPTLWVASLASSSTKGLGPLPTTAHAGYLYNAYAEPKGLGPLPTMAHAGYILYNAYAEPKGLGPLPTMAHAGSILYNAEPKVCERCM
jgi:hypothetical protein